MINLTQKQNEKLIQHSTSTKMSICQQCGKPFQQVWRLNEGEYTSFKTCPACRMANTNEFRLTEKQQEIINNPARIKLVMGGVRSGKTVTAILNMWDEMKRQKNPEYKVLFLVRDMRFLKMTTRSIKYLLPVTNEHWFNNCCLELKTEFGEIYISNQFLTFPFNNITIDNATNNKYVGEDLFKDNHNVYMTGHFPDDMQNTFFRLWLKWHFSDIPDIKAFRLTAWDIPSTNEKRLDYEFRLKESLGISRYNRDYMCIPDYLDKSPKKQLKKEYIAKFIEQVGNNEIDLKTKDFYIIGFDKAKE